MKKRRGCFKFILFIVLAVFLLYFLVGDGKIMIMKQIYPVKYQEYVERYADEYNLDRYLVYAVIKVESGFDSDASSGAGAKGLMQLMDATAVECNTKGDFGYTIPEDLYEAEKNIRMGCFYIRMLIDTYGETDLAIVAYNGGTGNVNKWLRDEALSDGKGGLRDIPYTETKEYLEKVKKTYEIYNKLYKTNEIKR